MPTAIVGLLATSKHVELIAGLVMIVSSVVLKIAGGRQGSHGYSSGAVGMAMIYSSFVLLLCCASTSHVYGYTHPGLGEMCQ